MPVPKTVRDKARRRFRKDLVTEKNLYGHKSHRNRMTEGIAGLHVSITVPAAYRVGETTYYHNVIWDFVPFIQHMDAEFAQEIKDAKRRPGFYDLHSDGRFEYRSLPASVCIEKLERVVTEALRKAHVSW